MQLLLLSILLSATVQTVLAAPPTPLSGASDNREVSRSSKERKPSLNVVPSYSHAPKSSPIISNPKISISNPINQYDSSRKTLSTKSLDLSLYPEPWKKPDPHHPQVQAVINIINWNLVPKAPIRTLLADGGINFGNYSSSNDPYCWWSATNCVSPKINYIPEDIYTCPRKGEWGLTFDDGPLNLREQGDPDAAKENVFAEPKLYNFLADNNVKSDLFFIGSNVATYPAAAKRGFDDGHYICSHTWSHPVMTTLTNEEVVAELYWTLRAIKDATGVTPRCWRPPQGDVDDRIRSIAWQMGMRTMLWDRDTADWALPAPGGGTLSPAEVDKKFIKWLREEKSGKQTHGTIVLQHELNSATILMAEKWLPRVKDSFKVVSATACNDLPPPYWETV